MTERSASSSSRSTALARPAAAAKAEVPADIEAHLTVDVVIIGGGITGAICAYLFSDAGISVALLESKDIGRGSTVASTALLMQEPDRDFADLARRFGGVRVAKNLDGARPCHTGPGPHDPFAENRLRSARPRFRLLHLDPEEGCRPSQRI